MPRIDEKTGFANGSPKVMGDGPIRIVIVDDHKVMRNALRALLATANDIDVVGEARTGEEAIDVVIDTVPDVVLMDLVMRKMNGATATERILAEQPGTGVLVLTSFGGDDQIIPALNAGARGYLLKDTPSEELFRAIRKVAKGHYSFSATVATRLLEKSAAQPLSQSEVALLRLLAQGNSNERIAAELSVTETTVNDLIGHILDKLGCRGCSSKTKDPR